METTSFKKPKRGEPHKDNSTSNNKNNRKQQSLFLNISGLNSPIKIHRLADWIWKRTQQFASYRKTKPSEKEIHYLRIKWWKTIFQANGSKKQAGVVILISNKIGFQPKVIKKDKEGHFILIKGKIHWDELSILNISAPHARVPTFINETLLKLKAHTVSQTIIVADFHTPLSSMDISWKKETHQRHRETKTSYETNGFKDIYRTFHPKTK